MPDVAAVNALRRVPDARQRAHQVLRARVARARRAQGAARTRWRPSASRFRSSSAARKSAPARHAAVGDAVQPPARAGRLAHGRAQAHPAGDQGGARRAHASGRRGRSRIARRCCSGPPSCSPTSWRATVNAATMLGQAQDGVPVGDRRGVRADRLLALQRRLRAGALPASSRSTAPACGISSSTGRSRASSTRSRRSTSPRSAATCRRRRR